MKLPILKKMTIYEQTQQKTSKANSRCSPPKRTQRCCWGRNGQDMASSCFRPAPEMPPHFHCKTTLVRFPSSNLHSFPGEKKGKEVAQPPPLANVNSARNTGGTNPALHGGGNTTSEQGQHRTPFQVLQVLRQRRQRVTGPCEIK